MITIFNGSTRSVGGSTAKSDADPIEWLHYRILNCQEILDGCLYPDEPKQVAKILARIAKYFKTVTDGVL